MSPAPSCARPTGLRCTTDAAALAEADFIIVAVPTPVDDAHQPDFGPLLRRSEAVGGNLKRGATVVFESTVYPGATEEVCVPILEKASGMRWKRDFFVGYSPERINPGDKEHTLTADHQGGLAATRRRRSSGSPRLRQRRHRRACHRASSIKVAEAAKVIENTQRDLNIALMNELAIIFDKIGIDTLEVLEAAGTKWNFLPFRPGLVGGHCIGVDPYYLTHKADMLGYHPQVILAGRRINDGMGKFIAEQTVKQMIQPGSTVKGARRQRARAHVQGKLPRHPQLARDRRHPRARSRTASTCTCTIRWPTPHEARHEYGIELESWDALPRARAIVAAVAHSDFKRRPTDDYVTQARRKAGCTSTSSARPTPRSCGREASTCGGCDRGYARRAGSLCRMLRSAAGAAAALARHRERGLHRLASARGAARASARRS